MALITVPMPTVTGREHLLDKAIASLRATADVQIITVRDATCCGDVWQYGSELAQGDYIFFGADDIEMHPGWAEAATAACDLGFVPAPVIFHTDGRLQSCGGSWETWEPDGAITSFSRGPVIRTDWWFDHIRPFPPGLHYYTDNLVSERCRAAGIPPRVTHGYRYTHHMAQVARGAGMSEADRMRHDQAIYDRELAWQLQRPYHHRATT